LAVSFGALGHFLPAQRPALFAGVYRALRPGGVFAFPVGALLPVTSGWYWAHPVHRDHPPPDGSGPARGRQPEGPAGPRTHRQHALTAQVRSGRPANMLVPIAHVVSATLDMIDLM
jgi:hypothetical protein